MSKLLFVPKSIIAETNRSLQPYAQRGVECPLLWLGVELGDTAVVTTVAMPSARRRPWNYELNVTMLPDLWTRTRPQGLVLLAQIHTHPGNAIKWHSPYDDEHAISQGDGFLSIVITDYGAYGLDTALEHGVHEKQGTWQKLRGIHARERIRIVDSFIDGRGPHE